MRCFGILVVLLTLIVVPGIARGASTASQVLPGFLTMTPQANCPVGPCFVQFGPGGQATLAPFGSTVVTGNATGTTGAVVGTLAAVASQTTYVCGFTVSAIGGTAAAGPITVAGLVTSSMVFQLASSASGATLSVPFAPCLPASAVNTAITVTTTADGSASAVSVNSWGFQLPAQ